MKHLNEIVAIESTYSKNRKMRRLIVPKPKLEVIIILVNSMEWDTGTIH